MAACLPHPVARALLEDTPRQSELEVLEEQVLHPRSHPLVLAGEEGLCHCRHHPLGRCLHKTELLVSSKVVEDLRRHLTNNNYSNNSSNRSHNSSNRKEGYPRFRRPEVSISSKRTSFSRKCSGLGHRLNQVLQLLGFFKNCRERHREAHTPRIPLVQANNQVKSLGRRGRYQVLLCWPNFTKISRRGRVGRPMVRVGNNNNSRSKVRLAGGKVCGLLTLLQA